MSQEGAMLGGYFLDESDFKSLIVDVVKQNRSQLINKIDLILEAIANKQVKIAYQEWDKIQTEIFLNPSTKMLAILNFTNKEKQSWNFMDEIETLDDKGKISITKVSSDMKQVYCSDILAQHLSKLFTTVEKEEMSYEEVCYVFDRKKQEAKLEFLNAIKYGDKRYVYHPAIYGNIKGKYFNGKIADAYLNHIGKTHWGDFSTFLHTGNPSSLEHLRQSNVKSEENSTGIYNFVNLLLDSLNHVAWYTGGDLIVTGPSGEVIANIQLKTSYGEGDYIGNIATKTLLKDLLKVRESIISNSETMAQDFFDMLKTSAVPEKIGTTAAESIYDLAKEALKIK